MGPDLIKALIAAQQEFVPLAKTAENPHFKNKFVPLSEVVATTLPILGRHGLAISQWPTELDGGAPGLVTYLAHESGQTMSHTMPLNAVKADPQGQGSAITYARRYALMAVLGLVGDEDDDAERAQRPRKVQSERVRPRTNLDVAKEELRAAIKKAGLSKEQASEYAWVKDASENDIDNIKGLTLALESGSAV